MQIVQRKETLLEHGGYLTLFHDGLHDNVSQSAEAQVLHDNPELILVQEALDVVDDVLVVHVLHDFNFQDDQIFPLLIQKIDDFHRDCVGIGTVYGFVYLTGCP